MLYSRKALLAFIAAAAISTTPGCECEDNTSTKETKVNPGGDNDAANTKGGNNDAANTKGGNNDAANTKGGNNDAANTKGEKKVVTKKEDLSPEDKQKYETAENDKKKYDDENAKLPQLDLNLKKAEMELEAVKKTVQSVHDAVVAARGKPMFDTNACTIVDKMEGKLNKDGLQKCEFGKSHKWDDLDFQLFKAVEDKDGEKVKGWTLTNEKKKFNDLDDNVQKGLKAKVNVLTHPIDDVVSKLEALGNVKSGSSTGKVWVAISSDNAGVNAHFNAKFTGSAADSDDCNKSEKELKHLFTGLCKGVEPVKSWKLNDFLTTITDSGDGNAQIVDAAKLDARKTVVATMLPAVWTSFDLSGTDKYKDMEYYKLAQGAVTQASTAKETLEKSLPALLDKHNKSKGDLDLVKPEENQKKQ